MKIQRNFVKKKLGLGLDDDVPFRPLVVWQKCISVSFRKKARLSKIDVNFSMILQNNLPCQWFQKCAPFLRFFFTQVVDIVSVNLTIFEVINRVILGHSNADSPQKNRKLLSISFMKLLPTGRSWNDLPRKTHNKMSVVSYSLVFGCSKDTNNNKTWQTRTEVTLWGVSPNVITWLNWTTKSSKDVLTLNPTPCLLHSSYFSGAIKG